MFQSFAAIASILPALITGADAPTEFIGADHVVQSEGSALDYFDESMLCYDLPFAQAISDCIFDVDTKHIDHAKEYYFNAETISEDGSRFLTWLDTGIDYGFDSMTV